MSQKIKSIYVKCIACSGHCTMCEWKTMEITEKLRRETATSSSQTILKSRMSQSNGKWAI